MVKNSRLRQYVCWQLLMKITAIGCNVRIQACPVDAIVGATRAMHTVMSDPVLESCVICASIRVRRTGRITSGE